LEIKYRLQRALTAAALVSMSAFIHLPVHAEEGIDDKTITFGSVLALKGNSRGLGKAMQLGLQAALKDQQVQGKQIKLLFENDSYEPKETIKATNKLINDGIFLMIGNVGTPTAKASLPILAERNVPAVGFFTGAGLLRSGKDAIINYRASYVQETAAVINSAISHGIKLNQICAYVQNDAYGMAGLAGVKLALEKNGSSQEMLAIFDKIINMTGDNPSRNMIGPVGVYKRNTIKTKEGYASLKKWEQQTSTQCKLIVTVGAYANISIFSRNAQRSNEPWLISAVSFTGANNFEQNLKKYKTSMGVIMTQVVPLLNTKLGIVEDARNDLGDDISFVSLEGYIVGKMALKILSDIDGELTRENFMAQAKKSTFDIGGLKIDLTKNGYQASDLVIVSYLSRKKGFIQIDSSVWDDYTN
jgi:branched-chain amino acid transport system substrate-binding protein